jgi:Flp pilus assembly pilin Flp
MFESIKTCLVLLRADKSGVTAVEYAVIAGTMVLGVGAAFTQLGTTLKAWFAAFTF